MLHYLIISFDCKEEEEDPNWKKKIPILMALLCNCASQNYSEKENEFLDVH